MEPMGRVGAHGVRPWSCGFRIQELRTKSLKFRALGSLLGSFSTGRSSLGAGYDCERSACF